MKKAIIYLHGFNSASLDQSGNLLRTKQKLVVLDEFCQQNKIKLITPNLDYRQFAKAITYCLQLFSELKQQDYTVVFMGSSLGGFSSEYLALKTGSRAVMINPAIEPSSLLCQYIGVTENFETKQPFSWSKENCEQFQAYEDQLQKPIINKSQRTLLLDMGDELLDSTITLSKYQDKADVVTFAGGAHGFEHIVEALPVIEQVMLAAAHDHV